MTVTFNPPVKCDSGAQADHKVAGIESKFGDSYTQFTAYGINAVQVSFNAQWTNLKYTEATAIINFLTIQKGQTFYYTPNGENAPRTFRCKQWTPKWKSGRKCDLTAVFDPAAPNS